MEISITMQTGCDIGKLRVYRSKIHRKYHVANFNEANNLENAWAAVWQEFGYDINGYGWDDQVIIHSVGNGMAYIHNKNGDLSRELAKHGGAFRAKPPPYSDFELFL